jgi:hypothetical protein
MVVITLTLPAQYAYLNDNRFKYISDDFFSMLSNLVQIFLGDRLLNMSFEYWMLPLSVQPHRQHIEVPRLYEMPEGARVVRQLSFCIGPSHAQCLQHTYEKLSDTVLKGGGPPPTPTHVISANFE